MSSLGTTRRLRRLRGAEGRFLLFALDHGLPAGPLPGLEDVASAVRRIGDAPVTGLIVNPGLVAHVPLEPPRGLVVHLSAGTLLGAHPTSKVLACTVDRAVGLGADAVSVQIHFGDAAEERMLADAGAVVDSAARLGVPVVVMAYPPGAPSGAADPDATRHAARAAAEIGADVVQVPHPGTLEAAWSTVRGCPAPLVVAGGPRAASPEAFLDSVRAAMAGGAAGIAVGRNLFQHPDPAGFARRIADVVFGRAAPVELAEA